MEFDRCNCAVLRKATRHVTQFYDKALRVTGLNANQFGMLAELDRQDVDGVTLQALAHLLVVERSALARNLRLLEYRELVTVFAPPEDLRQRRVKLTVGGRLRVTEARPVWLSAQQGFVRSMGIDDSRKLRELLRAAISTSFTAA